MWKESLQLYKSVKKEQLHLMNSEKVTGWTDEQEIHKAEQLHGIIYMMLSYVYY